MNFEKLLKPYKDGGVEDRPVERTMGTIIDYLINKKGYPIDVVGAAIFTVFFQMDTGLVFKGDGSYGSAGRELITTIRRTCDEYSQAKFNAVSNALFIEQFGSHLKKMVVPPKRKSFRSWWRGKDVFI